MGARLVLVSARGGVARSAGKRRIMTVVTANRVLGRRLLTSLIQELDTHWAPDPWAWHDLSAANWRGPQLFSASAKVTVPFLGHRARVVPLLDDVSQISLHAGALEVLPAYT